jgi:hypothetical protein
MALGHVSMLFMATIGVHALEFRIWARRVRSGPGARIRLHLIESSLRSQKVAISSIFFLEICKGENQTWKVLRHRVDQGQRVPCQCQNIDFILFVAFFSEINSKDLYV